MSTLRLSPQQSDRQRNDHVFARFQLLRKFGLRLAASLQRLHRTLCRREGHHGAQLRVIRRGKPAQRIVDQRLRFRDRRHQRGP
jgi:hypothetical protein